MHGSLKLLFSFLTCRILYIKSTNLSQVIVAQHFCSLFSCLTNLIVLYSKCLFWLMTSLFKFIIFIAHSTVLILIPLYYPVQQSMGFFLVWGMFSFSGLLLLLCPVLWNAFLSGSIWCFITLSVTQFPFQWDLPSSKLQIFYLFTTCFLFLLYFRSLYSPPPAMLYILFSNIYSLILFISRLSG